MTELEIMGAAAKKAGRVLAVSGTSKKNSALEAIYSALLNNKERILAANAKDIESAESAGIKRAFLDRLLLTGERIDGIAKGVA